jgi:hypothetical protein
MTTMFATVSRVSVRRGANVPDLKTSLLICAVLLWASVQYGLMAWALRDLLRRPRVRGIGALFYAGVAPVTPIARTPRLIVPQRRLAAHDDTAA